MRRLIFILLGVVACLLFAGSGEGVHAAAVGQPAALLIDHAAADQWHCERDCNSDLNLPRVYREVTPSQAAPVTLRGGDSGAERVAFRYAADSREAEVLKITSLFDPVNLSSGARAADYYVFRLRRLII